MKLLFSFLFSTLSCSAFAQVAISNDNTTPHASAMLDIKSTSKGLLIPRMTSTQRNAIAAPAKGLLIYDSARSSVWYYDQRWRELAAIHTTDSNFTVQHNVPAGYNMAPGYQGESDSSGYLYDSGGALGNYGNNEDYYFEIYPKSTAAVVRVQLISLNTESPYDSLFIYQSGSSGSLRYTFCGEASNRVMYFSNKDDIGIRFKSNLQNVGAGFVIRWDNYFPPAAATGHAASHISGFHYIPEKIAVRGGVQLYNNWHKDSVGLNSFSYGYGTQASGNYSFNTGYFSKASGNNASAIGYYSAATGNQSIAFGSETTASHSNSTSVGARSKATNHYATALGYSAHASGQFSMALGYYTSSEGKYSTAIGPDARAAGDSSLAFAFGTATGSNATALGSGAIASGAFSLAAGSSTAAQGNYSTSLGYATRARGAYSHALGLSTYAKGFSSTVIGLYNDSILHTNQTVISATTPIFIIGNGDDHATRSNALVIRKDGRTYIDPSSKNDGNLDQHALLFGSSNNTGEGIASKRTTGGNQFGLDFYSNHVSRMSIANNGNVSIGSGVPDATGLLHVNTASSITKGLLVTGTYNATATVPDLGAGTRMMFYPGKAAFRAGHISGTHWNTVNVGSYSSALGHNTTASGTYSTAIGINSTASGNQSVAMGGLAIASGDGSVALGYYTTASGGASTAMGNTTTAAALSSTAMGYFTTATGTNSTAMGSYTKAKGYASTVVGMYNDSLLTTDQTLSDSNTPLFIVGNGSSNASRSNALVVRKSGNVEMSGTLKPENLQVGGGTIISKQQLGEASAGSNASGFKTYTLLFPTAFAAIPKVMATAKNDPSYSNVDDTFVVSVRSVSTTQVIFNIQRVDANTGWSQNLRIEWMAWE